MCKHVCLTNKCANKLFEPNACQKQYFEPGMPYQFIFVLPSSRPKPLLPLVAVGVHNSAKLARQGLILGQIFSG
jgi:hypothetical protein